MAVQSSTRIRRGPLIRVAAGAGVVLALVAGAILARGYDDQELPQLETSVWVTRDDGQYARVNTVLNEFDTVRAVSDPVGIVQSGSSSVIFSQGFSQAWPVDPAFPLDLDESPGSPAQASPTPPGTEFVTASGDFVLYLTGLGDVYLGSFPAPGATETGAYKLDPFAGVEVEEGEDRPRYVADAVAMSPDGTVVMYSADELGVRVFNADRSEFVGELTPVTQPQIDGEFSMSLVDDRWVLFDATSRLLWAEGDGEPIATGVGGNALLQANASSGGTVLIADTTGLVAVDVETGVATRVAQATGTPAAPVFVDGVGYAAWIGRTAGLMWTTATPLAAPTELAVPQGAFNEIEVIAPEFRSNGDRAVLNETATGLVWTVPDGQLLGDEEWNPLDNGEQVEGTVDVNDVIEQEPPVAVADALGVRSGAVVELALLYNDNDPNKKDVLTIDAASVSDLADPEFGSLALVSDDQSAVVRVSATAGTTTFSYAASDGLSVSPPATVTLTVVPPGQNTAPVWCGVTDCTQEWPAPQIQPGGFVTVPLLNGWVDPEGDMIALVRAQATDLNAPVTVVATDDGNVVIRHVDPNAPDGLVTIDVVVADALGATTTKTLEVRVTASPLLDARPIAVVAGVNDPRQVSIADYVSGGSGSYELADAVVVQGAEGFSVTPLPASGTIELSAQQPGEYAASYTVVDTNTQAQQTATIRYSVADVARTITLPPLVAFVRNHEDVTIDVLAAAQNTTGRVLIVAEATTLNPNLSVSVVQASSVRVSGTTDTGEPGRVGVAEVEVEDGAGGFTTTQLTVFLLGNDQADRPIAVPDALSVRAGTQVDISVLANDVSPRGARLLLHPDVQGSGAEGELAFASGTALRYLAPQEPGVYTISYTAYMESDPGKDDTGVLTITVVPDGSNRAPEPRALVGRVLAGQSVVIPFDAAGVDPDGDAVVLTDVAQPEAGTGVASVDPSGRGIVYQAPAGGVRGGQVQFEYTVTDTNGEAATGVVRVGVLGTEVGDVAPVTYGDYVGAQVDAPFPVTVNPLLNDHDPLGGSLRILSIVPNAAPGTTEYDRLAALIDPDTDLNAGTIVLRPGDVAGTHSYVYTVESSSTLSTAAGLVVLGVSDEASPDQLVVADTVLNARTRHDLTGGIDVVTGKVQWQTGDMADLRLELWGPASGYTSSGWTISGPLTEDRAVIPFSLTGTDNAGNEVVSYGFLRVPALEDVRLHLTPGLEPIQVGEEQTVDFRIRELLDVGAADVVQLRSDTDFAVQRDNSSCRATGPDVSAYTAGREAPWRDTCSVAVRLQGQEAWSIVAVPVGIIPKDAQAVLNPVSRTVPPGQTDALNPVQDMVTWEGGRVGDVGDLNLSWAYSGSAFVVTEVDGELSAFAKADSTPGTRETVTVTSAAYGGLSSTITLVVGTASLDAPRGADFRHQCDVSRGSSCTITVVGLPGEYDPFQDLEGGGLEILSVGTGGSVLCPVATVTKASPTTLVATWPVGQRPVGGECVAEFAVVDAQGRPGPGKVTIDILGYPQTPSTVTTVAYTGSSVTLNVALGPAADAHPNVSGVAIYTGASGGSGGTLVAADCAPAGPAAYQCVVSGLTNGTKVRYTARAVNSVGESLGTTEHETWAYQAPVITSLTAVPTQAVGPTSQTTGAVTVTVSSSDDTKEFRIENTTRDQIRLGDVSVFNETLPVGSALLQVTPISVFSPPISGGSAGATVSFNVTVAGAPIFTSAPAPVEGGTTVTIDGAEMDANYSSLTLTKVWIAWPEGGTQPTCSMNGSLEAEVSGAPASTSTTNEITGLVANTLYSVAVCGSNGYGATMSSVSSVYTWVPPGAPTGDLEYEINSSYDLSGSEYTYGFSSANGPNPDALADFTVFYWYDGSGTSTTFSVTFEPGVIMTAAYCATNAVDRCGPTVAITPLAATPSSQVSVTFPAECALIPDPGDVTVQGAASGNYTVAFYYDAALLHYTLTWDAGDYDILQDIDHATSCPEP